MGFRPGTLVTLDNALKMLMVKSPNDVAVMIAESISGSVEASPAEMNAAAAKLGLRESHFVNPNGLHDPDHYSSARDMAILARALLKEFPDHADLFDIGALQFGRQIIRNHNGLLGRYPGADGMKTGFTCPAGWNVVATAEHDGRKLIVVIFGSSSPRVRNNEAAMLFDRGFAMSGTGQTLDALPASTVTAPPDMRDEICHGRGRAGMLAMQEDFVASRHGATAVGSLRGRRAGAPMLSAPMEAPPVAARSPSERGRSSRSRCSSARSPAGPARCSPPRRRRRGATPRQSPPIRADKDAKPDEARRRRMALKSAVKPPRAAAPRACHAAGARADRRGGERRVTKKPHHQ